MSTPNDELTIHKLEHIVYNPNCEYCDEEEWNVVLQDGLLVKQSKAILKRVSLYM